MSGKRYTDEFKAEAATQVIEHGRSVREVAGRLGVSIDSLYAWVREQRKSPQAQRPETASGVTFLTLEDEHGMINAVVWPCKAPDKSYGPDRQAKMASRGQCR